MNKNIISILLISVLVFACFSSACSKPVEDIVNTEAPESESSLIESPSPAVEMLLPEPSANINAHFGSYEELGAAIMDSSSSGYLELRSCSLSSDGIEALGNAYNSFISGIESGDLSLPLPMLDGEPAALVDSETAIFLFSGEKFNLPCVSYFVECDGLTATVELTPLSVVDGLQLTGSEAYSDISKILAPLYPTEDTPEEQYFGSYNNVTSCEIELSGGRVVHATVLEDTLGGGAIRTAYRFIYDGFIVSIWESIGADEDARLLTDSFFRRFSLGGNVTALQH